MFLHLGHNLSVRARDVIAIHDYRLFAPGGAARAFFEREQAAGHVRDVAAGKTPKSLVMTDEAIYLSAISPTTLLRRTRNSYRFVHNNANNTSK
ncbi:extracellular matrix regulator RemB [Selenomonas sp.]|uniref:extracellular matrix regulator RemB n=1 Tax=Selenomonas sp. TaxID=2053611 RepID=UPI002A7585AC|nr:extracellular matrix/biofilm biosynthesis regulator RemA family protein [Selenomonas sp.]MDY3297741.1 DUF370 domain-containing protein [Selenomonas sp.]